MEWKDTLLPGASRVALPWVLNGPTQVGYVGDSNPDPGAGYQQRNDWVMGPNGQPVISGSSEAQPGAGAVLVSSPGFYPIGSGGPPVNASLPPAAMQAFYGLPVGQQQQFADAAGAPAQTAVAQRGLANSDLTNYQDLYRQILKALGAG